MGTGSYRWLAWIALAGTTAQAATCRYWNCQNQVAAGSMYVYNLAGTGTHCADITSACPPGGGAVAYNWPVTNPGDGAAEHTPLNSLLTSVDAVFSLPFSHTQVNRMNGWLYSPGNWHHAVDYARPGGATFAVRAAAGGRVIFAQWDPWSGNTVIVSHDVGAAQDVYRTIYMHLRNGPANDCELSWAIGVGAITNGDPEKQKRDRSHYKAHLNSTGCLEQPARRRPVAADWGTDDQKLDAGLVGRSVSAGDLLGWAGATGPGGQREPVPPNTHLHIFFARKQASDGGWYFFDPYGIYGIPRCYPTSVTEAPSGRCVAFSVAWRDGRPQYPNATPGCGSGPACPTGQVCSNGRCVPSCTNKCPVFPHPDNCFVDGVGSCVREEAATERQDCGEVRGACVLPCFRDGNRACKKDVRVRRRVACAPRCLP